MMTAPSKREIKGVSTTLRCSLSGTLHDSKKAKVTSTKVNGSGGGCKDPQSIDRSSKSNQQDLLVG